MTTPRRILLLITDLEIGGTPTVVRELAGRLREPGKVEIEVACLAGHGPVVDQLREAGIFVTTLNAKGLWDIFGTRNRLVALSKERGYDTIFSFLIHANFVAHLAKKQLPGVRFFQSMQTTQPNPRWHWWLAGKIQSSAEKLIAPSNAIVRCAVERSGIDRSRFVVIPNAIEPEKFPRTNVFTEPVCRVGFLGRIDPVKRLPIAIEAVASIGHEKVCLHIFGEGEDRKKVQLRQEQDYPDPEHKRFVWHGRVSKPQDALDKVDILVLPSIGEGFPMVLIEALACGVPVVASDAGGIPEIILHEKTGLLVPLRNPESFEFARAIQSLIADKALRDRLIDNGLQFVRDNLTWDKILPMYRQVLEI